MGCCLSKNEPFPPSSTSSLPPAPPLPSMTTQFTKSIDLQNTKASTAQLDSNTKSVIETKTPLKKEEKAVKEEEVKKKEILVIQPRKSNDRRLEPKGLLSDSDVSDHHYTTTGNTNNSSDQTPLPSETSNHTKPATNAGTGSNILASAANGQVVRTSSCTKEEVDAILIQCGRLSRSSSGKGNNSVDRSSENRRKYSGSKRSHDFDNNKDNEDLSIEINCEADDERQIRRHSRGSHRRRTPSRSRERDQQQQQRSGSRERAGTTGSNGRRVSRSPGRRSESPITTTQGNGNESSNSNSCTSNNNNKPGKMVSVPATVSNLSMDKSNNAGGGGDGGGDGVKRVLAKSNVGDGGGFLGTTRSVSSPRSRSPAARTTVTKCADENINRQQPSPSRNASRKAEHSPYRRTPLSEIDTNSLPFQPLPSKAGSHNNSKTQSMKNKGIEEEVLKQTLNVAPQSSNSGRVATQGTTHRRTRSRGGAESVEFNYCRVNEHPPPNNDAQVTHVVVTGAESVKLPQTIVRSRSLRRSRDMEINVEALLNPIPTSNYNSLLLQDIQSFHYKTNNTTTPTSNNQPVGKKKSETEEHPIMESQVNVGGDDLMEPSLQKYVTIRRRDTKGGSAGETEEKEESSGSNNFVGGAQQQNWLSSSSWEPNLADSTDCWISRSSSNTCCDDKLSSASFNRLALTENVSSGAVDEESRKKLGKNRRELHDHHRQNVSVRAKEGSGRGVVRNGTPRGTASM